QHPQHAEALGRGIADLTRELRPSVVLSPALGGVVIGHEVARALGARALFAERQDGALTLRRGFVIGEIDRVLVVEDVLTTGGSPREPMPGGKAPGGEGGGRTIGRRRGDCRSRRQEPPGVRGAVRRPARGRSPDLRARLMSSLWPGPPCHQARPPPRRALISDFSLKI